MKIIATDSSIGPILNGSKPEGVVVEFDPPTLTRTIPEVSPVEAIITLKIIADANLDLVAIAKWILSYYPKGIREIKTKENTHIKADLKNLIFEFDRMKKEEKKY